MNAPDIDDLPLMPLNEPSVAGGLLPAFAAKQYTHLPTPQSPNDLGRYVHDGPHSPESPVPYGALSSGLQNQRDGNRRPDLESNLSQSQYISQQYATPESSPHFSHTSHPHYNSLATATPLYFFPNSNNLSTPKQNLHANLECPTVTPTPPDIPEHCISASSSPSSEQPRHVSTLSSPFISKTPANLKERQRFPVESQSPHPLNSLPKCIASAAISVAPASPPPQPSTSNSVPNAGGEIERIRESMLEDRLVQIREAEKRRPEYLKRAKRMIPETDPNYLDNEDMLDNVGSLSVGIMESPHKGRRLKLFQETSEESFEESLMAGGYGRYRTADWVRQPQPVSLLPVATSAGSSTVVSILEDAEESPPSEKEVKKRKRLAAFKFETPQNSHKLCAIELEGKGRVLLDYPAKEQNMPGSPEPVANKKRIANRRKKRGADAVGKKAPGASRDDDDQTEKPNWPDTEFPWRLRTEERIESAKAEEDERLRWIERFLDRDSDDEDETDSNQQHSDDATVQYEDFFQNLKSDLISNNAKERLFPSGRGKMVPLPVYSDSTGKVSRLTAFPSDPADARAALLSKKSVRALSYRQKKRQRELDDEDDDEVVCICNGKDDGRELVQCDSCQTWYHLQCIGIKSIAELGREEDPWFCRRCVRSPSPLVGGEDLPLSEPTFVPTDDLPNVRRPLEASFFPPSLQESPNWASPRMPRTPTRLSSSNYSWSDSSRAGPSTPQYSAQAVRIYSSPFDSNSQNYEESPFDPTSTPSRGIKFHAPFSTPKGNGWLPRANASLFHTPSRSFGRGSSHLGVVDQDVPNTTSAQGHFERVNSYDESPIRRSRTDISNTRHIFHSPSRSRTSIPNWSLLEESPVVRSLNSQATVEQSQQRTDADSRFHERIS